MGRGGVDEAVEALDSYGRGLGHAFQIADDLLDVTSSAEELGKTPGKDVAADKATYPALAGVEGAKKRAMAYCDSAVEALSMFGDRADALRGLACFVVERKS